MASVFNASAQLTVDVVLDQQQFLPGESVPVSVRITNHSGQTLNLGADNTWLTFLVESMDGTVVLKKSEPDVISPFVLGSSEMATKHVDLAPYYALIRNGRFKVSATVHIKDWKTDITSAQQEFDIIQGAQLWTQEFGVPDSRVTNAPPRVRRYTLLEANYLRSQLRLYVQVSDNAVGGFIKVRAIGPMISFGQPEVQLDSVSNLHLLYQNGASAFMYAVINPMGEITQQEEYDYVNTRPRLRQDDSGSITVFGGIHRTEMLDVKSPGEVAR